MRPSLTPSPLTRYLSTIYHLVPKNRRTMTSRSYNDAVQHLNTLQSNAATLEAVRASGGRLSEFAIPEMLEYLARIGYSPNDLNVLNVIHITGTKGKGSTSAFTDSILRKTQPNWKIGLYTSPHLVAVRERIRINGAPISEELFAKYFFEVWDKLVLNDTRKLPTTPKMPGYFRFMTLLAFHVFISQKVNATVLEVGVGGTYDSTNIVPKPVVAGVTALGIDHVTVLGKTIAEIAWQKGGIFKEGVPALTVDQPVEGLIVLKDRAKELKASSFSVVADVEGLANIRLGLAGRHQVQNATIAVHLAKVFLQTYSPATDISAPLPPSFITGLQETRWPGRCQTMVDPQRRDVTWYLDGAHTSESLNCCMEWFVTPEQALTPSESRRVLIFNCTSGRSGGRFLSEILTKLSSQLSLHGRGHDAAEFFDDVIFCSNVTYADGHFKGDLTTLALSAEDLTELKTQRELASAWTSIIPQYPASHIHVLPSVEHAVKQIERISSEAEHPVKILVAGSLHLVGGVIEVAGLASSVM